MYERIDPFNSKIIIKKKEKYANAKSNFSRSPSAPDFKKKTFCWCSNLSNDDIISWRTGLKMGVKNDIFWSEIGSGFWEPCGTPPPRIPRNTPLALTEDRVITNCANPCSLWIAP